MQSSLKVSDTDVVASDGVVVDKPGVSWSVNVRGKMSKP